MDRADSTDSEAPVDSSRTQDGLRRIPGGRRTADRDGLLQTAPDLAEPAGPQTDRAGRPRTKPKIARKYHQPGNSWQRLHPKTDRWAAQ